MSLAISFLMVLIIIFPAWKIFEKSGLHPAWSLILFIPFLGLTIAVIVLAFAQWPALKKQGG